MGRRLAALLLVVSSAAALAATARADDAANSSYLGELVRNARAARLAEDRGWLRLLHYQRSLLGGFRSQADGNAFFRSPRGKTDPAAELEATLAGFFDATPHEDELDDAQCRFPARFAFLGARLGFDLSRLPPRRCPRLEAYLDRVRPQGATLVFSSYYLNNPASSFGHTLLRLDKAPEARGGRHHELLDYGVDYAASIDTGNAVLYALKGLLGFFKGEFKHYAYYYKVRKYGDYESRDLWEYDLALTPAEVALLAAHVWELGGTWFDYWYLDENCSYHVLGAIEAAAPRLELLSNIGRFVVLPSDTVAALFRNPGLVRAVHYRPSIRTQFEARARGLSGETLAAVETLARDPAAPLPAALDDVARARTLDAAVDLVDLRHARALLEGKDPGAARRRQALLERRAAIAVATPPLDLPTPDDRRPEHGHASSRAALGAGWSRADGPVAVLDLRLALHDLADPPRGFPSTSQIEFLPARLRFAPREGSLTLEDASLVRLVSLNPVSRFDLKPSWRARGGATTVRDGGCDGCLAGVLEGGAGFATELGLATGAVFADVELLAAPGLAGLEGTGFRPGVGPGALVRVRAGDRASFLGEARWRWLLGAAPEKTWALSGSLRVHATRRFSLAVEARRTPADDEVTGSLLAFF